MIRTQIKFKEEQYAALKAMAVEQGISIAELIRRAADRLMASLENTPRKERAQRILALSGRFSSGMNDVAERHDAYLDEAFGH